MSRLVLLQMHHSERWLSTFLDLLSQKVSLCLLSPHLPNEATKKIVNELSPHCLIQEDRTFSFPDAPPFPFSQSILLCTSGSTGEPKMAVLPLSALEASARHCLSPLKISSTSRLLFSLPFYHVGGLSLIFRALASTASWTWDPLDPAVTHISYVPTQLLRKPTLPPNLQCLLIGGAPLPFIPPEYTGAPLHISYGLTEMSSLVALDGTVLPGREVKIQDGEIFVRGETLFSGYFSQGKLLLPFDKDGWFPTRDCGRWNAEGKLIFTGRKDRMFTSGGSNIHPEEIERYLFALPEIEDALVIPQEDPIFGARPAALVVSKDPTLNLDRVREALSRWLPRYKLPVSLQRLERLPLKKLSGLDRNGRSIQDT